jgi:hypothetical protein
MKALTRAYATKICVAASFVINFQILRRKVHKSFEKNLAYVFFPTKISFISDFLIGLQSSKLLNAKLLHLQISLDNGLNSPSRIPNSNKRNSNEGTIT